MEICILLLIMVFVVALLHHYNPIIDIIVIGNKYKVLLWYNRYYYSDYTNKLEVERNYIQLFIV